MHEPDELCLGGGQGVDRATHVEPGIRPRRRRLIERLDEAPGQIVAGTDAAPVVTLHVAGDAEQPQRRRGSVGGHPAAGAPRLQECLARQIRGILSGSDAVEEVRENPRGVLRERGAGVVVGHGAGASVGSVVHWVCHSPPTPWMARKPSSGKSAKTASAMPLNTTEARAS